MKHPFDYQKPTEEQVAAIEQFRGRAKELYELMLEVIPEGAERTLAIRKLEEASMWGNKAIVFGDSIGYAL